MNGPGLAEHLGYIHINECGDLAGIALRESTGGHIRSHKIGKQNVVHCRLFSEQKASRNMPELKGDFGFIGIFVPGS